MGKPIKKFQYFNKEQKHHGHNKTVRIVKIHGGKGHKTMTHYKKGKKSYTVKKPLTIIEIVTIQRGKFIPGLFRDCQVKKCKGTMKRQ
jgi:hypothetical protein